MRAREIPFENKETIKTIKESGFDVDHDYPDEDSALKAIENFWDMPSGTRKMRIAIAEDVKYRLSRRQSYSPIQGQSIPSSSPEWWDEQGFLSEAAGLAFKKAMANGQVRIFSRRR